MRSDYVFTLTGVRGQRIVSTGFAIVTRRPSPDGMFLREHFDRSRTSLGVTLVLCDRTQQVGRRSRAFTDTAGFVTGVTAGEDKICRWLRATRVRRAALSAVLPGAIRTYPVRSPRFRASASVPFQRAAFAIGVPPDICAFHRYTRNSTRPYRTLARQFPAAFTG